MTTFTYRIVICGGRDFVGNETFTAKLDKILSQLPQEQIEIVSGGGQGADQFGEAYAAQRGYPVMQFLPNWQLHGRQAVYIRNGKMARYATHIIAFHDGYSQTTQHMIDQAAVYNLTVRVIRYHKLVNGKRDVTHKHFTRNRPPHRRQSNYRVDPNDGPRDKIQRRGGYADEQSDLDMEFGHED